MALNLEAGVMRLAARRLPKCSTACNQSSADRFRRSRIGGAFFGITPRFPGFNWRPVQSSNGRYSHWHVAQGSPAAKVLSGRKGPTLTTIRDYTPELSKPIHPNPATLRRREFLPVLHSLIGYVAGRIDFVSGLFAYHSDNAASAR